MGSAASPAQKAYYSTFLVPMWRGQLETLGKLARDYRTYLLALACLQQAKGPGGDPAALAEFCQKWQLPLTMPVIGPTSLLRGLAKGVTGTAPISSLKAFNAATGMVAPAITTAGHSPAALFDITGALNWGVKILGAMAPLLGTIQVEGALYVALNNRKIVSLADQTDVMRVLQSARTSTILCQQASQSKDRLASKWQEIGSLAQKMEAIRRDLGLPEDSL